MPPLFGVLLLLLLAAFFYKVYRHIARRDTEFMDQVWLHEWHRQEQLHGFRISLEDEEQFRNGYREAERWREQFDSEDDRQRYVDSQVKRLAAGVAWPLYDREDER